MRSLLTSGIKAILAIAALSTAAHWAFRVQREPAAAPVGLAALPDPVATGSIVPRRVERPEPTVAASPPAEPRRAAAARDGIAGLDQQHLLKLISGTAVDRKGRSVVAKR